jgi:hypothetical protein
VPTAEDRARGRVEYRRWVDDGQRVPKHFILPNSGEGQYWAYDLYHRRGPDAGAELTKYRSVSSPLTSDDGRAGNGYQAFHFARALVRDFWSLPAGAPIDVDSVERNLVTVLKDRRRSRAEKGQILLCVLTALVDPALGGTNTMRKDLLQRLYARFKAKDPALPSMSGIGREGVFSLYQAVRSSYSAGETPKEQETFFLEALRALGGTNRRGVDLDPSDRFPTLALYGDGVRNVAMDSAEGELRRVLAHNAELAKSLRGVKVAIAPLGERLVDHELLYKLNTRPTLEDALPVGEHDFLALQVTGLTVPDEGEWPPALGVIPGQVPVIAVHEESLLDLAAWPPEAAVLQKAVRDPYPRFFTLHHELAHVVRHRYLDALTPTDSLFDGLGVPVSERARLPDVEALLERAFELRRAANAPLATDNSALDYQVWFADAAAVYLGHGGTTMSDAGWLQRNDPGLFELMGQLFGPAPTLQPDGSPPPGTKPEKPKPPIVRPPPPPRTPGVTVSSKHAWEGDDADAAKAKRALDTSVKLMRDLMGRDSVDGAGGEIKATVHHGGEGYSNAFWSNGTVHLGDGDGRQFGSFATADTIGHELGHALIEQTARFKYAGESGAVHESFADIFGTGVEWYVAQADASERFDFHLGEDVMTPGVDGDAIRFMDDPGRNGRDIDHLSKLTRATDVRVGAGIMNNAFYLLAQGGTNKTSGLRVKDGIGLEKALRIFLGVLQSDVLTSTAGMKEVGEATRAKAIELYGPTSPEAARVVDAWNAVGLSL